MPDSVIVMLPTGQGPRTKSYAHDSVMVIVMLPSDQGGLYINFFVLCHDIVIVTLPCDQGAPWVAAAA